MPKRGPLPRPRALIQNTLVKIGIGTRLFLAMVATSALCVGLVVAATRFNFEQGFLGYLNEIAVDRQDSVVPRLAAAYVQHGNWAFLNDASRQWFKILRGADDNATTAPPGQQETATLDPTGSLLRLALLDSEQRWLAGYRGATADMKRREVVVDGRVVGWLVLAPFQSVSDAGNQRFAQSQLQSAIAVALVSIVLSAAIAWWMTRRLLQPVRQVAAATHRLAAGQRDVRVEARSSGDEAAQLARDFNKLAQTLERNDELRRAYFADISHELRTPLAVLRGELEALTDGTRPLLPTAIEALRDEAVQLGILVDDLYELALSDEGALGYSMERVDLRALIVQVVSSHQHAIDSAGLRCHLDVPDLPARLRGDAGRLRQLFDNLLENSRRYTDTHGEIRVVVRPHERGWTVDLEDSAPGPPAAQLDRMFERLFRGEASRNRASGGAGLGLAIARNIVSAHRGEITARSSSLGGVWIRVLLPHDAAT